MLFTPYRWHLLFLYDVILLISKLKDNIIKDNNFQIISKVRTFSLRPEEADLQAAKVCHQRRNFSLERTIGTFVLIIFIAKQNEKYTTVFSL